MNIDENASPDKLYIEFNKLAQGNINTQLILLAVKLNLPELLSGDAKSLAQLTQQTQCHGPTLERFLRGMCTLNLVKEVSPQLYEKGLILDLVYSVQGPGFGETAYQAWEKSFHTVKTGKPAWDVVFGQTFYEHLDNNPQMSQSFDLWNANSTFFMDLLTDDYDFGQFNKLVDIGGGQGGFTLKLLNQYPGLHGVIFDRAETINNTNTHLKESGLEAQIAARVDTQPGSFFESVPQGADAYTICRVLLNWDDEQVISILKTCKNSMLSSSKLLILDFFIPPSDDPGFAPIVAHDLNLLVNFGGGLRTTEHWRSLVEKAGLKVESFITAQSSPLFLLEAVIA